MATLSNYMTLPPLEYQKRGIKYALDHHYMILGDEMGLGKTYQALAVAALTGLKTAIFCPAYLKLTWEAEIKKVLKNPSVRALSKKELSQSHKEQFIIISYSEIKDCYRSLVGRKMVIGDEIHYVKNHKAQRTEYFHDILDSLRPERFMGLSGTPIKNRISEFYSILALCSYNKFKTSGRDITADFGYWQFCETFSIKETIRVRGRNINKFYGMRNVPLLKEYLKDKYLRRTSDKILDLPELIEKEVIVSYSDDPDLQMAWDSHVSGSHQEHVSTAKKASAIAKVKFTSEYVESILEQSGGPVVVFTEHPDAAIEFLKHLNTKHKIKIITGSTLVNQRQSIIEQFQAGKLDVLAATIGAASTGFTMHKSSNIVFNDLSWVPGDNDQAKKRIHRIGQKNTCFIHNILGSKVDVMIYKNLISKSNVIGEVL